MKRMIGRTGLVTMMRAAGTAVLAVGVAATAFAADPVGGAAPVAKPLTTAASLLVAPDDTATPDKKEEGQDPAAANPVVEFFKQTEIYGLVDGYYLWAFNEENPQLRNFDIQHNAFTLNYVEIAFAKPVSETSRGGFRVDFGAGETANLVNAFEPGGADYLKHVQQAYVSYLAPVGKGLTIDFGKFVTPAGAEVIENKDNFNYSRGLLFALAIPYYHAGFRVGYAVNDKVSVTGYLVNGWNNVIENNGDKTVGVSLGLKPNAKTGVFVNYLVGKEFPDEDDGGTRNLIDIVGTYAINDKTSVVGNFDYARDSLDDESLNVYGVALGLKYQATDKFAVSPRYEWLVDDDGFATGLSQTLQEITLTGEYKASGGLITRFEFRSDFSDEDYFVKDDGLKSSQPTASVSFIYAFSSK
jgi:Putative beta-barrel porin-2, OmpL-like. bbp2